MWKYDSDRFEWAMELPKGTLPHYPHNDSVIYAEFSYGIALVKLHNRYDGGITLAILDNLPSKDCFADLGLNEVIRNRVERAIRDTLNIPAWYVFTMEGDYNSNSEENLKARFGAINSGGLKAGFMPALQLTPTLQLRFRHFTKVNNSVSPTTYKECIEVFLYKNGQPVKSQIPRKDGSAHVKAIFDFHTNEPTIASILEFIVSNIEALKQNFITEHTLNYEC
jgi:hypothetical protein